MSKLFDFAAPYIQFLNGAAYNIEQTLEGLKVRSSNFLIRDAAGDIIGSYWSPGEAALVPLGVLLLYLIFLIVLIVLAAYVLGRIKGVSIALLLIALPGFSIIRLERGHHSGRHF